MIKWLKRHRIELTGLAILLFVAGFLRFYRIGDYMTFLGDEGRDALVVRDMLVNHHLHLLGPPMSFGNVYLGPLYYYMMAVAMAIFWLNPVAAAGMVALIGTLTVGLIYYLARSWFGMTGAFVAAFLYAISPVTITYSRSSWNPNPAPFFALLTIIGFFKARSSHNYLWLILSGGSLAAAIQMHYTAVVLILVSFILWIVELTKTKVKKNFVLGTVLAIWAFFLVMLPLFLFDLNHQFLNYHALANIFFGQDNSGVKHNLWASLAGLWPLFDQKLIGRYMAGGNGLMSVVCSFLVLLPIGLIIWKKPKVLPWPYFTLIIWLGLGLISLTFYNQAVYDHYFGSINPTPYLLLGGLVNLTPKKLRLIFSLGGVLLLGYFNLKLLPLLNPPNNQLARTELVAKHIIDKSDNQPFNFALLSPSNYDAAYQYYFDVYNRPAGVVPSDITDQLWVVCEDASVCQPINNPKYEIAAFGWSKIVEQETFQGVGIFKLIHNN